VSKVELYIELWNYLRVQAKKTLKLIDNTNSWNIQVKKQEFKVSETLFHTLKSIYEDAGRWFLHENTRFKRTNNWTKDLDIVIDRMINAIASFSEDDLSREMKFQWGDKTTIGGAIQQNLYHAIGHFSQLRNWVGIYLRSKGD
jgi:hypothetical protein